MRVFEARISYEATLFEVDNRVMDTPAKVIEYLRDVNEVFPANEVFYVILLNRKMKAIGRCMISLGTVSGTLVHNREVFKPAILAGASSIIISHNHPSGDPAPSSADLQVTRQIREASRIMDIALIDHVILGDVSADPCGKGYYSFRECGLI